MNRVIVCSSLLLLLSCALGCEPRESATLCLFSSAEEGAADPGGFECQVDPTSDETAPTSPPTSAEERTLVSCPAGGVDEKVAYFLRHDLPEGLVTIGALKIHMETPCPDAGRDLEATHVDSRVLFSFMPPRGASCAFVLTATMAQSELACEVVRPPVAPGKVDPCADLDALCAEPGSR